MSAWPQLIYLALCLFSFGVTVAKHGEPTKYNAGGQLVALLIILPILYWGGFFNVFLKGVN